MLRATQGQEKFLVHRSESKLEFGAAGSFGFFFEFDVMELDG